MKLHLTPLDLMRLSAAREQGARLPLVEDYNHAVKLRRLIGQCIVPIGTKNALAAESSICEPVA